MATIFYARAVNPVTYTVTQVDPPDSTTYTYAAGERINGPSSSVLFGGPMLDDDPLILSGDITPLIQVRYVKCLTEVIQTYMGNDYSYNIGDLIRFPFSTDDIGEEYMLSDDSLLANATIRLTEISDFPMPRLLTYPGNVFDDGAEPEVGTVIGTAIILLAEDYKLANYFVGITAEDGVEGFRIDCASVSIAHSS